MLNSLRKLVGKAPDRAGTLMATTQPNEGTGQVGTLRALSDQLEGVGAECADLRTVFSAEQIERANSLVPSRLLDFFGWAR